MGDHYYYVYIMTNPGNSVLYTGMTNDISNRVEQHRSKLVEGFTKKYNCIKLVYVEVFSTAYEAITREKQIKGGSRNKKMLLISTENPDWKDISSSL
jgi:putative endonuclease